MERTAPIERPPSLDRPSTLDRPSSHERPSSLDRPSANDRPTSLDRPPVDRPAGMPDPTTSAPVRRATTQNGLPQRVPAEPDVPDVPGASLDTPHASPPDLARIAAHLRHDDIGGPTADGRPDGFDIPAVLEAVRGVQGVREAKLNPKPGGGHMLRLELADDADPGWVSRAVARLLNEKMGLAAEPTAESAAAASTATAEQPLVADDTSRHRPVSGGARHTNEFPAAAPSTGVPMSTSDPLTDPLTDPLMDPLDFDSAELAAEFAAPNMPTTGSPVPVSAIPTAFAGGDHILHRHDSPPLVRTGMVHSPRVLIDGVDVRVQGVDAVVEVRLTADGMPAVGRASGLDVDTVVLRMAAEAAASAIDVLLVDPESGARGRCIIEHAVLVPLGNCEVAVVVLQMNCDGWIEQLTGSSIANGDPRSAMVRATLGAVNRRLEGLLP
jgi:hypothetical protein